MAVSTSAVIVGTDATPLLAATNSDYPSSGPRIVGRQVAIANLGSVTVYVGGSDVTTANGFPVSAGEKISIDVAPDEALYGISGSAGQECRVFANRG